MKKGIIILLSLLLVPVCVLAHTTTLVPHTTREGEKTVKVIHFNPFAGAHLMGIRLGVDDSMHLKGLDSIFVIHKGENKDLSALARPDYYQVRDETRETYTIPINRKSGFSGAGDYVIVVQHKPHWKKQYEMYKQKVAKFYINRGGLITDWPKRVLKEAPEIIPLVPPYTVYAGSLFRAEVVNDEGKPISHAEIMVEYLNYPVTDTRLDTASAGYITKDIGNTVIFTDSNGSFSFVPPREGIWTFTLVDGDDNKLIKGERLEYDSSLSIMAQKRK